MEEIPRIREQLQKGIDGSPTGSGERVYYETKMKLFMSLVASILSDAMPKDDELEFYSLSYRVDKCKKEGVDKKELAELEDRLSEVRSRVVKTPHTRMFQ